MQKKYIKLTLFFLLVSLSLYAICILVIDPLQQYRKASWYKPTFVNQRYLNPGLAKTYEYDSIILGTSMTENFSPNMVNEYLNFNCLKLSIEGSSAYEQSSMFKTSLSTGKIKNVIWGLDFSSFEGLTTRLRNGQGSMPFYLYDNNLFNDYQYVLNIDIFKKYLVKIFLGNILDKKQFTQPLERFQYWGDKFKSQKNSLYKKAVTQSFELSSDRFNIKYYNDLVNSFNSNFLKHIQENENINFIVFFPPYSSLYWSEKVKNNKFNEIIKLKKYIIKNTQNLKNIQIFDFQDIEKIIFDFNNYKDYSHFSVDINKFILESIKHNRYLLNSKNINKRINNFKLQMNNFHININKYNERKLNAI